MKSLARDTAIYGLSSIVARFINYLLVPIQTARFAASGGEYGVITNVYAYVSILIILLTFGMETGPAASHRLGHRICRPSGVCGSDVHNRSH